MKVNNFLAAAASLVAGASAFGAHQLEVSAKASAADTTVLPPSQDPWYAAPAGYESASPGTILKIRSAPGNTVAIAGNGTRAAYNILYRTTNSQYNPSFAVTTLFIPTDTDCTKLLSYQIPYDSADVNSSPSYTFTYSTYQDIINALDQGWVVSSPDYEGPLASFTAGVESGHATLDSVRAVLSAGLGPTANATRYAMWGYSGGALASEWASELQVQYAPELNFAGAALGGLTPNVSNVIFAVNGTIYAGLVPAGILGVASQYPELQSYLNSTLKTSGPYNITGFYATKGYGLGQDIGTYLNQNLGDYFKNGIEALQSPEAQKVIARDGVMGYHGLPQIPLFAYKAIGDQISPIADTDELIDRFCLQQASNILYQRNTIGDHVTEEGNGDARAFAFVTYVLEGTWNHTGCTIENVTVTSSNATAAASLV